MGLKGTEAPPAACHHKGTEDDAVGDKRSGLGHRWRPEEDEGVHSGGVVGVGYQRKTEPTTTKEINLPKSTD